MWYQRTLTIPTTGRGTVNITRDVEKLVREADVSIGLCHIFMQHTSASLILCENADPNVRIDLETFMADLVPDGDGRMRHTQEGPDDMAAHIRTILTHDDLTLPIHAGSLHIGIWQGVYVWEHRYQAHERNLVVTVQGE
ncbi:MAG: secondary thiamine-phosphate synthase enzyme [Parasphingorhabdus sp.]|jgi:secondary thiamine-phosphate synthase enzyme